jgi:hypothetical protein
VRSSRKPGQRYIRGFPEVLADIDRIRDQAQSAFLARDVDEYMRMFSPSVVYKQKDGTVLSHARLAAEILRQLRVIPSIHISRIRDSYEFTDDGFMEVMTQCTTITANALFLITRTMEMTRKGRYVWSQAPDGWQIVEAEILSDEMNSHWALGFLKPRRIS